MMRKRTRQTFSPDEDERLKKLVKKFGENWEKVASKMKNRTIRQCRERYLNTLSDKIIKSNWTKEEDELILLKYQEIGSKWKTMELFFPGRVQYDIRNRYKSLMLMQNSKVPEKESEELKQEKSSESIEDTLNNLSESFCKKLEEGITIFLSNELEEFFVNDEIFYGTDISFGFGN
ncbi:Myb-like DNA-binding domain containing protein [Tritrichomonas foetus]|uniref:Myb-like DNA-binding domain containing protein n=1 Tax=Tritrichomonas foetus TaxID=1144522 RepID=A0A1J4J6Z1_9EUKA|nr:Myb-like DNA-binding domain containing protein [Tritrichomonas foetus]|eukprot:OHS94944.1 Myb-like DNA-binding domain containing protein [Tritrichomonas foetus]